MSRQANVTKLTLRTIAALPLPPAGRKDHIIFDSELRGLGVRVTSAGGRSWLVQYRVDGRVRRYSLGRTTSVTPEQARRRAQIVLAAVAEGRDPYSEQRKAAISGRTLADVANEFVEKHAKPKQRTWRETERRLKVYVLPHWGDLPIGSVTRQAAV